MIAKDEEQDQSASKSSLRTSEVVDVSELQALRPAWSRLADLVAHSSVFLTFEWVDAAWEWLGKDHELRVVCCFDESELVGLAPLCRRSGRKYLARTRELSLIEIPDSQLCDVISRADMAEEVVNSTLAHLKNDKTWDVLRLPKLEPTACLAQFAIPVSQRLKMPSEIIATDANLEVEMAEGWESYYATRSRRLKKGNNNIRNRINGTANEVTTLWSRDNNDIEVAELLEEFKKVSASSWKKDTGLTLDQSGPSSFIDRLSKHALEQDWHSLWALKLDGRIVATEYQIVYKGVVSALRADYDPDVADLSPGSYLNWQLLQRLDGSDLRHYRMGPGSNQYKFRWSNKTTPLQEVLIYNRTLVGRYLWCMDSFFVPAIRRLINAFGKVGELVARLKSGKSS
jgi:CelD/BcsL family acetyltransferase involved in cellulose biosynthesis